METIKGLQARLEALKKQLEEHGQPVTVTDINHLLDLVSGGTTPFSGGGPGEEQLPPR